MSTRAMIAKEEGNDAFRRGDYANAVGHYTTAILADAHDPTYPLNRAAAYLRLGKHEDAERDCSTVLKSDKNNVKAWFRRGQARLSLGALDRAQTDFQQVLKLDAKNAAAQEELKKIEDLLLEREQRSKASIPRDVSGLPAAISSPKRRRVPITIIDPSSSTAATTIDKATGQKDALLKPVSSRPIQQQPSAKPASFQEAKKVRDTHAHHPRGGIFRQNGQHTIFGSTPEKKDISVASPIVAVTIDETKITAAVPEANTVKSYPPHELSQPSPSATRATLTHFDFSRKWDSMRTFSDRWNLLVENVPPISLPSLFKTSLETSLLVSILHIFKEALQRSPSTPGIRTVVKAYMLNLTRVPRFSTIVLLMSREERALVKDVWVGLSSDSPADDAEQQARNAWRVG